MKKQDINVAFSVDHKKVGGKGGFVSTVKVTLNGKLIGGRTINGKASETWVKKELKANPASFVTLDTTGCGYNAETLAALAGMLA